LAVSHTAPLTDRQQTIRRVWGDDVNVTLAESIIADEATRFGVSTDEFFNTCTVDVSNFELTADEREAVKTEMAAIKEGDIKLENKEQFMNELTSRAPKTYAILQKRLALLNKYVAKLTPEAQTFAKTVGNTLVNIFGGIARASPTSNGSDLLQNIGADVKEIYSDYHALPQSAKDSLDKTFCVNATIRIVQTQIEQYFRAMITKFAGY
ncbi:hypothetical protein PENTCL1PPCAC_15245, partial [Pristionchus entomophagus]